MAVSIRVTSWTQSCPPKLERCGPDPFVPQALAQEELETLFARIPLVLKLLKVPCSQTIRLTGLTKLFTTHSFKYQRGGAHLKLLEEDRAQSFCWAPESCAASPGFECKEFARKREAENLNSFHLLVHSAREHQSSARPCRGYQSLSQPWLTKCTE